jgi:hypothetical protein
MDEIIAVRAEEILAIWALGKQLAAAILPSPKMLFASKTIIQRISHDIRPFYVLADREHVWVRLDQLWGGHKSQPADGTLDGNLADLSLALRTLKSTANWFSVARAERFHILCFQFQGKSHLNQVRQRLGLRGPDCRRCDVLKEEVLVMILIDRHRVFPKGVFAHFFDNKDFGGDRNC